MTTGLSVVERRRLAGALLAVAGTVITIGITVAGALYPDYSIRTQTISALGATDPSGQLVQPAAMVFTLALGLSGALLVLAGLAGWSAFNQWLASGFTITGLGIFGVGVFPAHVGLVHAIAALIAFAGGALTALIAAWTTKGPIQWMSAILGGSALLALVVFLVLGGKTALGVGGLERVVSLSIQCWTILFGGWLLGHSSDSGNIL